MSMEPLFDGGIVVPEAAELDEVVEREPERVRHNYKLCRAVCLVPRRLGPDSTPEERAEDRALARRMSGVYWNLCSFWMADCAREDLQPWYAEAARLEWGAWLVERADFIERQRRVVWTYAVQLGEVKRGRMLVHKLDWELAGLLRAARSGVPASALESARARVRSGEGGVAA